MGLHQVRLFILILKDHITKEKCQKIKQMMKTQFIKQKNLSIKDQSLIINLMEVVHSLETNILLQVHTNLEKELKVH